MRVQPNELLAPLAYHCRCFLDSFASTFRQPKRRGPENVDVVMKVDLAGPNGIARFQPSRLRIFYVVLGSTHSPRSQCGDLESKPAFQTPGVPS